jgi:serine/threonine protein kinase
MKFYKSGNGIKGKGINKFSLKCEEEKDKWLNILDILYKNDAYTCAILKGLYDNKKDIVLKAGIKEAIEKEYEIAKELNNLPNFIRYYCKFICFDDLLETIKNYDLSSTYRLCEKGKNQIGILTMNYYSLGSIGTYKWNEKNLQELKNVLKQTVYSYILAFSRLGFIHGDLHCDNVLLKNKRVFEIDYDFKKLAIDKFEVRIMDFEKSRINKNFEFRQVLNDIQKLFNSISTNENYSVEFSYNNDALRKMKNKIIVDNIKSHSINKTYFDDLDLIIDSFDVEYIKTINY